MFFFNVLCTFLVWSDISYLYEFIFLFSSFSVSLFGICRKDLGTAEIIVNQTENGIEFFWNAFIFVFFCFELISFSGEELWLITKIQMSGWVEWFLKWNISHEPASASQVRYLKIIEKSGYQALPWVRYITQSGGKNKLPPTIGWKVRSLNQ